MRPLLSLVLLLLASGGRGDDSVAATVGQHTMNRIAELLASSECRRLQEELNSPEEELGSLEEPPGALPEEKNPEGKNPEEKNPRGNNPEGKNPEENTPKENNPKKNTPKKNNPKGNNPKGNNPDKNNPKGNNPKENNPKENTPEKNNPEGNNPKENNPKENNPKENTPKRNTPEKNTPKENTPVLRRRFGRSPQRCSEALRLWLVTAGEATTWDHLVRALHRIGRSDIARELGKNLNQDRRLELRRNVEGYRRSVKHLSSAQLRPPGPRGRRAPLPGEMLFQRLPPPSYTRSLLGWLQPVVLGVLGAFLSSVLLTGTAVYCCHWRRILSA